MCNVDKGKPVDVIYLGFEKALDKVPYQTLLKKVKSPWNCGVAFSNGQGWGLWAGKREEGQAGTFLEKDEKQCVPRTDAGATSYFGNSSGQCLDD